MLVAAGLRSLLYLILDLLSFFHLRPCLRLRCLLLGRFFKADGSIYFWVDTLGSLTGAWSYSTLSLGDSPVLAASACLLLQKHLLLDLVLVHLLCRGQVEVINYVGDVRHAVCVRCLPDLVLSRRICRWLRPVVVLGSLILRLFVYVSGVIAALAVLAVFLL